MTGGISIPTSSGIVSEDDTLGTNPASEIENALNLYVNSIESKSRKVDPAIVVLNVCKCLWDYLL